MTEVTRMGAFDMQVCVPKGWSDEKIKEYADSENECGTMNGWHIRKQGHEFLNGSPERAQCSKHADHIHIMLDA